MKKCLLAVVGCLLCLLLAGCTEAEIGCGVGENHNAFLRVGIQMDLTGADAATADKIRVSMRRLASHYRNSLGYEVDADIDAQKDSLRLDMLLSRSADSYAEAFEKLKEMLNDEKLTPFTIVNMTHSGGNAEQGFAMEVRLNADKLLEGTGVEYMPQDIKNYFEQGIADSTARLQLFLPASQVVEHTGSLEQPVAVSSVASTSMPVSFAEPTDLKLVTRINLRDGMVLSASGGEVISQLQQQEAVLLTGAVICAVLFVLCAVFCIVLLIRRRKAGRPADGHPHTPVGE